MSLVQDLYSIQEKVKQQKHLLINEDSGIFVAVIPFIKALGWDPYCQEEVRPQYSADPKSSARERVDFAIVKDDQPLLLIECKSAQHSLNERHWQQLYNYFSATSASLGLLTNGIEYRFYTDCDKPNIMDRKPFYVFNVLKWRGEEVKMLENFMKDKYHPVETPLKLKVLSRLQNELKSPSDLLVGIISMQVRGKRTTQPIIEQYRPWVCEMLETAIEQEVINRREERFATETQTDSEPIDVNETPVLPLTLPVQKAAKAKSGRLTSKQAGEEGLELELYGIERKKGGFYFIARRNWVRLKVADEKYLRPEWRDIPVGERLKFDEDEVGKAGLDENGKTIFVHFV